MTEDPNRIFFWQNPMTVLSAVLIAVIVITGIIVFSFAPETAQTDQYSLLYDPVNSSRGKEFDNTAISADIQEMLSYIDINFNTIPPHMLRELIGNVLILAPDNKDALIFAMRFAEKNGTPEEFVSAARELYRHSQTQANLYYYVKALYNNMQYEQAYDVVRIGRDNNEYSPMLDLLTAELALENDAPATAATCWHKAGSPDVSAAEYPLLADFIAEQNRGQNSYE